MSNKQKPKVKLVGEDGNVYWGAVLEAGVETSKFMEKAELLVQPNGDFYYVIHIDMQASTNPREDWPDFDGNILDAWQPKGEPKTLESLGFTVVGWTAAPDADIEYWGIGDQPDGMKYALITTTDIKGLAKWDDIVSRAAFQNWWNTAIPIEIKKSAVDVYYQAEEKLVYVEDFIPSTIEGSYISRPTGVTPTILPVFALSLKEVFMWGNFDDSMSNNGNQIINESTIYWTRSRCADEAGAMTVCPPRPEGVNAYHENIGLGVRPALWIDIEILNALLEG